MALLFLTIIHSQNKSLLIQIEKKEQVKKQKQNNNWIGIDYGNWIGTDYGNDYSNDYDIDYGKYY